jgi:hypothetical protein
MYHSHHDEMTQMAMGMMGMIVVHPRRPQADARRAERPANSVDRDFVIMLSEWKIVPGSGEAARPQRDDRLQHPHVEREGVPGTAPLVAKKGERVRIRFGNLSAMDHHPIHLHGYYFKVVATDGGRHPNSAQWPGDDGAGAGRQHPRRRVRRRRARRLGDALPHDPPRDEPDGARLPNMIGVDPSEVRRCGAQHAAARLHDDGQARHGRHGARWTCRPEEQHPDGRRPGPFDYITMGGMFTIVKVRDELVEGKDPGWYVHPPGTVAEAATASELSRDGIEV